MTPDQSVDLPIIAARLDTAGIVWGIFAGAAVHFYAGGRPVTDVDILARLPNIDALVPLFPEAEVKPHPDGEPTLVAGGVDLVGDQVLSLGCRRELPDPPPRFVLDDEMVARRVWGDMAGTRVPVVSPEDNLVFKAIMQRGPECGKHDLEDVQALLSATGGDLDWDYVSRRAARCGALARVQACLVTMGITI